MLRDVRDALKINLNATLHYNVSDSEARMVKARSLTELSGMLKRPNQAPVSVETMDEAIADCTTVLNMSIALETMCSCGF